MSAHAAPTRAEGVEHLHQLTADELDALFETVEDVQTAQEAAGTVTAHNLAIHDGACAGQPTLLPHTHVHVVPRTAAEKAAGVKSTWAK